MTPPRRYHRKQQKAKQRQRRKARERLAQEQARAQGYLRGLEQALQELGVLETIAEVVGRKLKAQGKLLGKLFGLMFPPLFGCRSAHELSRVRGWDKNLPARLLGALPKRKWVKQLRQMGQEVLAVLWQHVEDKSPATRSRWQWTWVADDSVFKKYGEQLGLVGLWWSGQEKRVRLGIDGLLLVVVIGDGKLVVPVDFEVRRPDPEGPGRPCRDKLTWLEVMLDRTLAALQQQGLRLPGPLVVADSWFGDSGLLAHVATAHQGTVVVEGKSSYVFHLPDGRRVKGQDLLTRDDWPWHDSAQLPGVRYARLTVTSPTYGLVTLVLVKEPGQDPYYLLCLGTRIAAPRLIRAFGRRSWVEWCFRTLKSLLATETCQVHGEDAYYGHFVLRLLAFMVLVYTTRCLFRGRVTMEEMVFSLKHHWRFLDSEALELQALSWAFPAEVA